MFLEKGWKTFIRSRNLKKRDSIIFRYDGDETLWARCFDSDGDRVECYVESTSSSDSEFYNGGGEAHGSSTEDDDDSENNEV